MSIKQYDYKKQNFNSGQSRNNKPSLFLLLLLSLGLFFVGISLFFRLGTTQSLIYEFCDLLSLGLSVLIWFYFLSPMIDNIYQRVIIFVVINVGLYFIIRNHQLFFIYSVQFIFGLMGLFTGLVHIINAVKEYKDGLNYYGSLIWALIYIIIGSLMFTRTKLISFYLGSYLILMALNIFWECFKSYFEISYKTPSKTNTVVLLPTLISAFLPIGFFNRFSSMTDLSPDDNLMLIEKSENSPTEELTVYIHMLKGLIPGFGHVDLALDDLVYCYGNFDKSTWKLGGFIADGVIALIPKDQHIEYALNNEKKILLAYTVKLTPETKEAIKLRIMEIMKKAYSWKSLAEQAENGEISANPQSFNDPGSQHYRGSHARYFKFHKKSPYKTYFALGTNCAQMANDIIGNSGIQLFNLSGIITPGTFIQYFNELYSFKDTIVVDRNIYMLNQNGKPYIVTGEQEEKIEQKIA